MVAKWILVLGLSFTCIDALSQLTKETQSHVHWRLFPFVKGTNNPGILRPHTCGVYNTADDREAGSLTLEIDCKSEAHKFKSGFIEDKSAIKIVRNDDTYSYLTRDLYGYRDCDGNEYHFFGGKAYELLNPGEAISIYRIFQWKGKQRIAKFFFRKELSVKIKPLTLQNLKSAFSDEPVFLENLHFLAPNDFHLIKHQYAINRLRMNALDRRHGSSPEL